MNQRPSQHDSAANRRQFLATSAALGASAVGAVAAASLGEETPAAKPASEPATEIVRPPTGKPLLLSCKLGMIAAKADGKPIPLAQRLAMAKQAGFDGVDFDQAAGYTPAEVRAAVIESQVFVHNAINHAHWRDRLTSPDENVRAKGRANIAHCLQVSHAAGGSGVLIVIGRGDDGSVEETTERCRNEIRQLLPLAASLGQMILIENVWNKMFYDHDGKPEQSPQAFIDFVDSFNSPWVGMYYDIGNHWKYGQPGEWIRQFGRRCVKLDVKGYSRKKNKWADIGEGDLPWDDVRAALKEIGFCGWATAEVKGGHVERLTQVRKQMQQVFGLEA